jgi:hypothetical protein
LREVEKEKASEELALSHSKKRKLKNTIPFFEYSEDIQICEVTHATTINSCSTGFLGYEAVFDGEGRRFGLIQWIKIVG